MHRAALGGVRAGARPGADRGRRGARLAPTSRTATRATTPAGWPSGAPSEAGAVLLAGSATPRPESRLRLERIVMPERVDGRGLPPVELVGMAGVRGALHSRTRDALVEVREPRREGDRAAQPARLVELPVLPRLRTRVGVPELRRHARAAPRRAAGSPAITAATPSTCPSAARTAGRCRSPATARAPSGSRRSSSDCCTRCRCSAWTPTLAGGRGAILDVLRRFERGPRRRAGGHADGREGPRLPRRDPRRGARRRLHAALPRLPRRGAHLRAGGPAGRPQRARGARRAGDRAGPGPGARARSGSRRGHDSRGLPGRRARAPPSCCGYPPYAQLVRVVCSSPEPGPEAAAAAALRDRIAAAGVAPAARAGAAVPPEGPLPRPAAGEGARRRGGARRGRTGRAAGGGGCGGGPRAHRGVSFSVDVDPQ